MKSSKPKTVSYYESFLDLLYGKEEFSLTSILPNNSNFKTPQQLINFNTDLYDAFHGRDGWVFNLLTGKLEKSN